MQHTPETYGPRKWRLGVYEDSLPLDLDVVKDNYLDQVYRIEARLTEFGGMIGYSIWNIQDRGSGDHDAIFVRVATGDRNKLRALAKNYMTMYFAAFDDHDLANVELKKLAQEVGEELPAFKQDLNSKQRKLRETRKRHW